MITKRDLINLESLMYLNAISQYAGKRKASEALGISVDTISKYVANLEKELGQQLLASNGRGSCLTQNGRKIVDNANKVKNLLDDLYGFRVGTDEVAGRVRLGMTMGINYNLTLKDIGEFLDQYPDLSLEAISINDTAVFKDQNFDLGIGYEMPSGSDMVVLYTKEVRCGLFASPEYLAKNGYPRDLEDLTGNYRVVHRAGYATNFRRWRDILKNCRHIGYVSNTSWSLTEVIRNGGGIGLLPMRFKNSGLVCLDNMPCEEDATFYLFAHKNTKDIPRVRTVINFCKSQMDKI